MQRLQLAGQDSSLKMYANIQYVIYLLKENISKDKNMDIISKFFCYHSIDCFRLTTHLSENNFPTATHSSKKCD